MPIEVTAMVTINSGQVALESGDLEHDIVGFFYVLEEESTQMVVVRLKGKTPADHALITGVRSVPTPDSSNDHWTNWASTGDAWVSPAWPLVSKFRIVVQNSAGATPVPRGGGHFRVVEQGGGDL
jgi:hypothetical protein